MDTVIKYLQNPIKMGVHNGLYQIDISGVRKILESLVEEGDSSLKMNARMRLRRLDNGEINLRNCLPSVLATLASQSETNAILTFYKVDKNKIDTRYKENERMYRIRDPLILRRSIIRDIIGIKPFSPHILRDTKDVLIIDDEDKSDSILSLNVISLKESGLLNFEKFLNGLPYINQTVKRIKYRQTHSTRYVFRPYYLAAKLLINEKDCFESHEDLINLIGAAIQYYSNHEWRTSIILSSICVESMLADIYEEELKTDAPDIALGGLFEKMIKAGVIFPDEIVTKFKALNASRISAAHRSKYPITDREANIALYGVISFLLWYNEKYY